MEQHGGKPRQQLDLSSEDGSMSPLGPAKIALDLRAAIEAEKARLAEEKPADAGK
jgi:hypothetical protein